MCVQDEKKAGTKIMNLGYPPQKSEASSLASGGKELR